MLFTEMNTRTRRGQSSSTLEAPMAGKQTGTYLISTVNFRTAFISFYMMHKLASARSNLVISGLVRHVYSFVLSLLVTTNFLVLKIAK